jgi:ferric-dicitrate binding protein FerR (iron transport regulator)
MRRTRKFGFVFVAAGFFQSLGERLKTQAAPHSTPDGSYGTRRRWRWLAVSFVAVLLPFRPIPGPDQSLDHAAAVALHDVAASTEADVTTDAGEVKYGSLSDGTQFDVTTSSKIHLEMTPRKRRAVLMRGGAFFATTQDKRPFILEGPGADTQTNGGSLAAQILDDGAYRISVAEGTAYVFLTDAAGARRLRTGALRPIRLTTGQMMVIRPRDVKVSAFTPDKLERDLAWRRGEIWLNNQDLATAVAEFNRFNKRKLVIADPTLAAFKVGGHFDAHDPDSFVMSLGVFNKVSAVTISSGDTQSTVILLMGSGEYRPGFGPRK